MKRLVFRVLLLGLISVLGCVVGVALGEQVHWRDRSSRERTPSPQDLEQMAEVHRLCGHAGSNFDQNLFLQACKAPVPNHVECLVSLAADSQKPVSIAKMAFHLSLGLQQGSGQHVPTLFGRAASIDTVRAGREYGQGGRKHEREIVEIDLVTTANVSIIHDLDQSITGSESQCESALIHYLLFRVNIVLVIPLPTRMKRSPAHGHIGNVLDVNHDYVLPAATVLTQKTHLHRNLALKSETQSRRARWQSRLRVAEGCYNQVAIRFGAVLSSPWPPHWESDSESLESPSDAPDTVQTVLYDRRVCCYVKHVTDDDLTTRAAMEAALFAYSDPDLVYSTEELREQYPIAWSAYEHKRRLVRRRDVHGQGASEQPEPNDDVANNSNQLTSLDVNKGLHLYHLAGLVDLGIVPFRMLTKYFDTIDDDSDAIDPTIPFYSRTLEPSLLSDRVVWPRMWRRSGEMVSNHGYGSISGWSDFRFFLCQDVSVALGLAATWQQRPGMVDIIIRLTSDAAAADSESDVRVCVDVVHEDDARHSGDDRSSPLDSCRQIPTAEIDHGGWEPPHAMGHYAREHYEAISRVSGNERHYVPKYDFTQPRVAPLDTTCIQHSQHDATVAKMVWQMVTTAGPIHLLVIRVIDERHNRNVHDDASRLQRHNIVQRTIGDLAYTIAELDAVWNKASQHGGPSIAIMQFHGVPPSVTSTFNAWETRFQVVCDDDHSQSNTGTSAGCLRAVPGHINPVRFENDFVSISHRSVQSLNRNPVKFPTVARSVSPLQLETVSSTLADRISVVLSPGDGETMVVKPGETIEWNITVLLDGRLETQSDDSHSESSESQWQLPPKDVTIRVTTLRPGRKAGKLYTEPAPPVDLRGTRAAVFRHVVPEKSEGMLSVQVMVLVEQERFSKLELESLSLLGVTDSDVLDFEFEKGGDACVVALASLAVHIDIRTSFNKTNADAPDDASGSVSGSPPPIRTTAAMTSKPDSESVHVCSSGQVDCESDAVAVEDHRDAHDRVRVIDEMKISHALSVVVAGFVPDASTEAEFMSRIVPCFTALMSGLARHQTDAEVVIVEAVKGMGERRLRDLLHVPAVAKGKIPVRVIEVTKDITERHTAWITKKCPKNRPRSFYEYMLKNVGIRRARGANVLITNLDILFSGQVFHLFSKPLSPIHFYRVDGWTMLKSMPATTSQLPSSKSPLDTCRAPGRRSSLTHWTDHDIYLPQDWASGAFVLAPRGALFAVRGYYEMPMQFLLDGFLLCQLSGSGYYQRILPRPCNIYHVQHDSSKFTNQECIDWPTWKWDPSTIDNCNDIIVSHGQSVHSRDPLDYSRRHGAHDRQLWGLGDMQLNETVIV